MARGGVCFREVLAIRRPLKNHPCPNTDSDLQLHFLYGKCVGRNSTTVNICPSRIRPWMGEDHTVLPILNNRDFTVINGFEMSCNLPLPPK